MCESDHEPTFISATTINEVIDLMRISSIVLLGCTEDNLNELKEQLHNVVSCIAEDEESNRR